MASPGIEQAWPARLHALLASSPIVNNIMLTRESNDRDRGHDGEATFRLGDEPHRLVIECKHSGQPRHVRTAMSQLSAEVMRSPVPTQGLVVAPFISPASRAILIEGQVGWFDLAGNARIVFPRFHLEINQTNRDPFATKRSQRSLFFPKSARLLKLLLQAPQQAWKVTELAQAASVSAGQVSNVRKALIEREWAQAEPGEGLRLTQPEALLDAWRDEGAQPPKLRLRGHTLKHGSNLDAALAAAFSEAAANGAHLLLASHSVARRAAPFARVAGEFFYADDAGLALLQHHLQTDPSDKGENVTVFSAHDEGLWQETMVLGPTLQATGVIQTYLDLLHSGERGREAAEHWRSQKITPLLHPSP